MEILAGVLVTLSAVMPIPGTPTISAPPEPIVQEAPAPDPELLKLDAFLKTKRSPIPADVLIKYPNKKMVLAIAAAESGYCKHQAGQYNCWGIKDFRPGPRFGKYRHFSGWEEALAYASQLLFKYDKTDGNPTPGAMVRRWTGYASSPNWMRNTSASIRDFERTFAA